MKAVAPKNISESDCESFRDRFDTRLIRNHGDVNVAATAVGKARQTIHVWRQPGGSLPDIYQVQQIANARRESPAWLAFGIGPEKAEDVEASFEISKAMETDAALRTLLTAYKKTRPSARSVLSQLATELAATEPSASDRAGTAQTVSDLPILPEEARVAVTAIQRQMSDLVPAESAQWDILDRVSKQLALLCAPLKQQSPAPDSPAHADSDATKKAADASASTPRGKKSNRPSKDP